MTESRSTFAQQLGAAQVESPLLVLFIPRVDRDTQPLDQDTWVHRALATLGELCGGATAFPQGQGVWRDDAQGGRLVCDEPVVMNCSTSETLLEAQAPRLRQFLIDMGEQTRQGAIGLVIDRDYLEISFPLREASDG